MSALDTLFSIFKSANPDASDEDIKAHLDSMKASPDQLQGALAPFTPPTEGSFTPDAPVAPSPASSADLSLKFPTADSMPSSFDVGVSDNTATQNGQAPSVSSAPENVPAFPPPPTPVMESVTPDAPPQDNKAPAAPAPKAAPSATPKDSSSALKDILTPSSTNPAEDAMKKKNQDLKLAGGISGLVGGIGDAIGNAAVPFGGKGSSGTQERINENTNEQIDKNKASFEDQQRKDPTSNVSKHYQKVLGLMLGDHAKSMDVSKMSAENIASTLPEVEKYMQKELGLKQIQSNKELQMGMQNQNRQDKLEKEGREWYDNLTKARNGELGVQNAKVDQARHLLQAFKQAEETGKPFTNSTYREVAVGLANLMSTGGKTNAETEHAIAQATAKGDFNKALTYAGFDPQTLGGTTESMMRTLKDSVLRQGMEAENQRNKFIEDHKKSMPSGLDPKQFERLTSIDLGNSLKEFQTPKAAGAIPKANAPENTVKKIGNRNFTVINGQWHEIN